MNNYMNFNIYIEYRSLQILFFFLELILGNF